MEVTSRTGLLASPTKILLRRKQKTTHMAVTARPAPLILKPLAGLYNPYPCGCSLLCNHPAGVEARDLLKRARATWATEGRYVLLKDEVAATKVSPERLQTKEVAIPFWKNRPQTSQVEDVPEELFRRYTETDSRPLTPAPTVMSGRTRASGSRRCVTPDPNVHEKTLLVLDLRRSHSQETLTLYTNSSPGGDVTSLVKIQRAPRGKTITVTSRGCFTDTPRRKGEEPRGAQRTPRRPKSYEKTGLISTDNKEGQRSAKLKEEEVEEDEEDFVRRKGKRKKKRGRDVSGGRSAFQANVDPETQITTVSVDSKNASRKVSLVPDNSTESKVDTSQKWLGDSSRTGSMDYKSYLDAEILKQLRKELDEDTIVNEFNYKRRLALEEVLKTTSLRHAECEELTKLRKELNLAPVNTELWLTLPRVFTRSSARFELPMDSRTLTNMSPTDYLKDNVRITSARKLLYGSVFKKFQIRTEDQQFHENLILGAEIPNALNTVMGRNMTDKQYEYLKRLLGWLDRDKWDFRTFCGMCALCERLLASEYCPHVSDRKSDPCHEIETVDFESLDRRLAGQTVDERLFELLNAVKDS